MFAGGRGKSADRKVGKEKRLWHTLAVKKLFQLPYSDVAKDNSILGDDTDNNNMSRTNSQDQQILAQIQCTTSHPTSHYPVFQFST